MKWYKHDANANSDAKLRRVRLKYGMEGYGLYWYCLELIAQNVDKHNLSFELEHDAEIIAADTGIHFERVQEMMIYMVDLGLFEQADGTITCLKLAKRCDEYTAKLISHLPSVPTNSRQSPDKVRINRTEQKRLEQKRTETKKARKRAPENFDVTIQMYEWAERELGVPADIVNSDTAEFKDHEFAKARTDWLAAWRNWLRRAQKWRNDETAKRSNPDSFDAMLARTRAAAGLS